MEMKISNYMLEIDILSNSSHKNVGVLMGAFEGFGCPKRHLDTIVSKTMVPRENQASHGMFFIANTLSTRNRQLKLKKVRHGK